MTAAHAVGTGWGSEATSIADGLGGQKSGSGFIARCPAHEDSKPSLSIRQDGDRVLVKCHAGCRQEAVIAALREKGLWKPRLIGISRHAERNIRFVYNDERGSPLHSTVRTPRKKFWQEHFNGGRWNTGLGARLVLYRLNELLSRPRETIHYTEGEGDADRLLSLGRLATTSAMGAGKWRDHYADSVRGRDIVIFYDNDSASKNFVGQEHAKTVALSLLRVGCQVRIVDLPEGKDVSDFLDLGHAKAELDKFVEESPYLQADDVLGWRASFGGVSTPDLDDSNVTRPPVSRGLWSYPHTDLGNAERLIELHGEDLRYCHPWVRWLVWCGSHFRVDDTAKVIRFSKDTTRRMFADAAIIEDTDKRDKALKYARESEESSRVRAMIDLATAEVGVPVLPEQLDADPWKLNVLNGTINLRNGSLQRHRREDLITKKCSVAYDPDAKCPTWMAFQGRITNGNEELLRFKQRAFGYALTGIVTEKRSLFIYQGGGNNGKTTELELYRAVLGDYAGQIPIESLLERHRPQGNGPSPDVADLRGLRLVISSEPPENTKLAEAKLKYLTSMGIIKARHLHRENFEFKQTWKIFLDCNPKPVIRGTDGAIWNRISLVPFEVTIPDDEIDPGLPEKLSKELPGILAWAVQGCLAWQQEGLTPPAAVQVATADYRSEMDIIKRFLEECCVVGDYASVRAKNLYQAYKKWCEEGGESGENLLSLTSFGTLISKMSGISKRHD